MTSPDETFAEAYRCHAAGNIGAAARLYQEVVRANPRHAHAWHQLACIAAAGGQLETAEQCFVRAIRIDGRQSLFHNNLGDCYRSLDRLDLARASFQQAARLDPTSIFAHANLSLVLDALGRRAEAEQAAQVALTAPRTTPEEHREAAALLLMRGEFAQGWSELQWRMQVRGFAHPKLPGPPWDGRALEGQSVLVWAEQGLGDTLQFVRYLPRLAARGARPVLWTPRSLLPLLNQARLGELAPLDEPPPECDFHTALFSLPHWFGTTLETVPRDVPYLKVDEARAAQWRARLAELEGVRVGICWQGNPRNPRDRARSVPLERFAPLAAVPGVRLIGLQTGAGAEQLARLAGRFSVVDLGSAYHDEPGAFVNAAAIISQLDLVISIDSAIAHLAGALAVPTWVALPLIPDWRWLRTREDSPWYPTMKLFRQQSAGAWNTVFERMAADLAAWAAKRG